MSHLTDQSYKYRLTPGAVNSSKPFIIALVAFLGITIMGCDTGPADSLYDADRVSAADPVVSSVDPPVSALAGVDVVTITGQNFSSDPASNLVYFDDARAEILSASTTVLQVLAPNTPGSDIVLKLSVIGAENYTNDILYELLPAAEDFGDITAFEEPFALTSDTQGDLYVSLYSDGISVGIVRFAPDGSRSSFVETTFKWDSMVFGPDDLLYTVRSVRAIFRFEEGGSQQVWGVIPNSAVKLTAITFDASGNVWAGGNNDDIYSISPDKSITASPFIGNVRALIVFEGNLYAAATQNGDSKIWKFSISGTSLGPAEQYFDVTALNGSEAVSLAFATNGDLFVGTDAVEPVIVVSPGGGAGESLYPGVLDPVGLSLAWGNGPTLYMTRGRTSVTTPNIISINTRREGAH